MRLQIRQQLRRLLWVCAVRRRRFPVGASPTRQPLQPEATGAAMEETKWLKPSDRACARALRETGRAAAPAARCRNLRRGCFMALYLKWRRDYSPLILAA